MKKMYVAEVRLLARDINKLWQGGKRRAQFRNRMGIPLIQNKENQKNIFYQS